MSFVVEEIKTAELIAEFESFGLKDPFNGQPAHPWRWVVDRERGWYFVHLGGGASEMPSFLVLFNRAGVVVDIQGQERAKGPRLPKSVEVWWTLEGIVIPKQHANRAGELMGLIEEALTVWGALGNTHLTKAVHIKSPAPVFY